MLYQDGVQFSIQAPNVSQDLDEVTVGVLAVGRPIVNPHHDPLSHERSGLRCHDPHFGDPTVVRAHQHPLLARTQGLKQ